MAHPLEQKIAQVRTQARRLLVLYAAGWTCGTLLAVVLLWGLADYALRFQDHGIRLMGSLAVVLALAWACYRFWRVGMRRRLSDVEIAQRIERRFPSLTDQLASTIQFLKQSETDAQAGSAALRRNVILETASATEGLDFSQVFERRPTRRALAAAAVAALVAVAVAAVSPADARIAIARLVRPLGNDAWPKF